MVPSGSGIIIAIALGSPANLLQSGIASTASCCCAKPGTCRAAGRNRLLVDHTELLFWLTAFSFVACSTSHRPGSGGEADVNRYTNATCDIVYRSIREGTNWQIVDVVNLIATYWQSTLIPKNSGQSLSRKLSSNSGEPACPKT